MARFLKRDGIQLAPALNPEACRRTEPYVIWGTNSRRIIETQPTAERAKHAADVLNEHALKNNGGEFYTWDLSEEV